MHKDYRRQSGAKQKQIVQCAHKLQTTEQEQIVHYKHILQTTEQEQIVHYKHILQTTEQEQIIHFTVCTQIIDGRAEQSKGKLYSMHTYYRRQNKSKLYSIHTDYRRQSGAKQEQIVQYADAHRLQTAEQDSALLASSALL